MTIKQQLAHVREMMPDSMDVSANPERLRDDLVRTIDCLDALLKAVETLTRDEN